MNDHTPPSFKCSRCGGQKPVLAFAKHAGNSRGYSYDCKVCKRLYYKANQDAAKTQRLKQRVWLNGVKDKPCMDCGNKFPPECMDFDHRPGTVKKRKTQATLRSSMQNRLDEIAKCDLVCSNCHRIRTRNRKVSSLA